MDEFDRLNTINNDGLLSWSRGLLWMTGVMYLLIGCGGGFGVGTLPAEGTEVWLYYGLGAFLFFASAFFGLVNFFVANGLANGSKWAWFGGLVLAILYVPSICFPIGALIIVGLARKPVREAYGIG